MLPCALSKRWLERNEARSRLSAGALRPSHMWPNPHLTGASAAARLPAPFHSHLCAFAWLTTHPSFGGPAPAMLLVLPCLLQGDLQGCPVSVSCGSCRVRPQFTLCLIPAWPSLGTLASIQPADYTHTRPCPIHKPHLGHPCVVCLLEREWVGREPGGLTFRGTVMTMGSHLRSCSL